MTATGPADSLGPLAETSPPATALPVELAPVSVPDGAVDSTTEVAPNVVTEATPNLAPEVAPDLEPTGPSLAPRIGEVSPNGPTAGSEPHRQAASRSGKRRRSRKRRKGKRNRSPAATGRGGSRPDGFPAQAGPAPAPPASRRPLLLGTLASIAIGVAAGATSRLPGDAFGAVALGGVMLLVVSGAVAWSQVGPTRRWLLTIVVGGFLARVLVASLIHAFGLLPDIDAVRYEDFGRILANHWRFGDPLDVLPEFTLRYIQQLPGYFYLNAAVFSVLGPNALAMRVLNAGFGALTALVVYHLARRAFGPRAALVAGALAAFAPSFVIWSTLNLKDPAINLLVALALLLLQSMQRSLRAVPLLLLGLALAALYTLRPQMTILLVGVLPLAYLLGRRWSRRSLVAVGAMLVVGAAALWLAGAPRLVEPWLNLDQLSRQRYLLANDGGSGYAGDVQLHTLVDLLAFYPTALAYFLFAPFPWTARTLTQIAAAPDMVLWYALLPFAAVGLWRARRQPLAMGLIVFALAYMLSSAPIHANIGTLHRQRIIFCAAGYVLAASALPRRLLDRLPAPFPAPQPAAAPVPATATPPPAPATLEPA